ncbi:MAG: acetoin utilization protein AcuC [Deltaproteobacteria bacterium]|jgi:acetoin utilization protein AcuC|nr:acetoin utilization protein AcuC [Deltaproteobacteria bacterium]
MRERPDHFASAFIYSEEFSKFEYSSSHPFKPGRAKLTLDLCRRYGLVDWPWIRILPPQATDFQTLAEFHDETYLKVLKAIDSDAVARELWPDLLSKEDLKGEPRLLKYGLGTEDNPVFSGVYDFSLLTAGATLLGARKIASGEIQVAFNPVGGFHHAGRDHAEGFCYVNDIAVAVIQLLKQGLRVAVVDIDAHHGNGVQDAFYGDNRVLVISFHQNGKDIYPWSGFENEIGEGRGKGFTVNVPLPAGTDDEIFERAFEEMVPPLLGAFKPDIVIGELGADTHLADPLSDLNLTNLGYSRVVEKLAEMSPRLLALGGGGYDLYKTARNWTLAWAVLNGLEPRDEFAGVVGGMMFGPEADAGEIYDKKFVTGGRAKEQIRREVDRVLASLKNTVFPLHQI